MIYKAIALSLAILIGLGTIVPLVTTQVEAGSHRKQNRAKKKSKKHKKYSKKWWRAYRQRTNRQKSMNARKRNLRLRQIRLANARAASDSNNNNANQKTALKSGGKVMFVADSAPAILPSGEAAPRGWKRDQSTAGELQFRVDDESGTNIGSAAIAVVGPAVSMENEAPSNKTVGGVSTSALRRTVIDRMIREEGWVVNDYQKQVGGKRVYVVVAQSPGAGGAVQSRLFYFTEVDGRIYSVATNAAKDNSHRIEQESEKAINSLQRKTNSTQQAELK
jgi:hypothetical protein